MSESLSHDQALIVTFVALEVARLHHGILMLQMVSGTVLVAPLVARRT